MDLQQELTTKEKALAINLQSKYYGSFAEIGAGQETAEHFFKAGGASGTIAKTMSAYDMKFSDAIYGKAKRYVCKERLQTMLDHEYDLLEERLDERSEDTCFFAYANTVETLNYRKTNRGHGWIGLRFQLAPGTPTNEVILHVGLKDNETRWQQEAIGILGVNLIYGCLFRSEKMEDLLETLVEGLSLDRVEIDMIEVKGPDFKQVDNRLLALKLVRNGLTQAAMFGPDGTVLHPSDALYKKNVLILRGRFRPVTHVNMDMLESGKRHFMEEDGVSEDELLVLFELTLNSLQAEGGINERDFLDRVDILCSMGQTVMISNYYLYYRLVSYLTQFNRDRKVGLILGVHNLELIFEEDYYTHLKGGILEAFGILFGRDVKLYTYPALQPDSDELYCCENFQLRPDLMHLFQYLHDSNKIEDITGVDPNLLHITSDETLAMIKGGQTGWEQNVPKQVEQAVKMLGLFGYQDESEASHKSASNPEPFSSKTE
ncbi:TonB-dependent receptor [Pontibacter sp. G13]|uniref:TonB-dependent receptor n=1 Tax=Pontibacter sp. G13 TaxID=3074898 RepID=UPI00288A731E|nr:TonB-dependent receptor [Pontibacter sp. G13]WNJ20679.1 TonB-dependent receptor [Pontibacter sp. G13]